MGSRQNFGPVLVYVVRISHGPNYIQGVRGKPSLRKCRVVKYRPRVPCPQCRK